MMNIRSSDSEDQPRKRLRKGTHSCFHCRQRKVRCVFEANSLSCNDCLARNNQCFKQDQINTRSRDQDETRSTRQRIQRLESAVEQLHCQQLRDASNHFPHARPPAGGLGTQIQQSTPHHARDTDAISQSSTESDNVISSTTFSNAPLLELFDIENGNQSVYNARDKKREPSWKLLKVKSSDKKTSAYLRAHTPDTCTMRSILVAGRQSSAIWHAAFPSMKANDCESKNDPERTSQLISLIYSNLHSDAMHEVVKVVISLALQLQQLPLASAISLPFSSELLQNQYISSTETLLSADEGLAGTINGLECMMMLVDFYINVGNMRKVWLIVRRAVSLAQLLSVHQSTNERQQRIWSQLWQLDRGFSLILGLPYTCPELLAPNRHGLEAFLCRLGTIGGHIFDRNHDRGKKQTYSITIKIDEEMEECKNMMSESWWKSIPAALNEARTVLAAKMRFFAVRKLLHLPFMLSSYTDSRYSESRTATLQSAKSMIGVFRILRDQKKPIIEMCEMADFQVFSAALTVAVDLLVRGGDGDGDDWELIELVGAELRRLSEIVTCSVAAKGAQVLGELCNSRRGRATAFVFAAQIPYFGNIRVRLPESTSTAENASIAPELSGDSFLYPYGDTQPWCDEDFGIFDIAMGDDWSWSVEDAAMLGQP